MSRAHFATPPTPAGQPDPAAADWTALLSDPAGRRVIARILAQAGLTRPAGPGLEALALAEGARRVALAIIDDIAAAAPQHLGAVLSHPRTKEP